MHALTRVSLKNRLLVGLITLAVAAFGLFSLTSLRQELMPATQDSSAYISIRAEGLSPEQIADSVLTPIEQSLKSVSVIRNMNSSATSSSANILLTWPHDKDLSRTFDEIQSAVNAAKSQLPESTTVEVLSGGSEGLPAVQLSAATSGEQAAFVAQLEKSVLPELRAIKGVQSATLSGNQEQEVRITLRPDDVSHLGVDTSQLSQTLTAHSKPTAAGSAHSGTGPTPVTVGEAPRTLEALAALALHTEDGPVTISQFADVELAPVPSSSVSRVNGKPALTLAIVPIPGANVVNISHEVERALTSAGQELGAQAEFVTLFDQAPYIEQSIEDLSVEGGLGLLFAVLVILAFLWSFRPTVIAAISIPLSLLITMIGLRLSDNTLNILTLGALTIAVGRVVDDSIVVIENITRRQGAGQLTLSGVLQSVQQVAGAITASTLTTVAVFLPIIFLSGLAGQLFRPFALTVSIALLSSLVVALTIVPVLAFWLLNRRVPSATPTGDSRGQRELEDPLASEEHRIRAPGTEPIAQEAHAPEDRLQRAFMPILEATKQRPKLTLSLAAGILVATLFGATILPIEFLSNSGQLSLSLSQKHSEFLSVEDQTAAAIPVEEALASLPEVASTITAIGEGSVTREEAQTTTFTINLVSGANAERVTQKINRALDSLNDVGELELTATDAFAAGGSSTIDLNIMGEDSAALAAAATALEEKLAGMPGVASTKNTLQGEEKTLRVRVDPAKAAAVGYDQSTVSSAIDAALDGVTLGAMILDGTERPIRVAPTAPGTSPEQLGDLLLPVTATQTAQSQRTMTEEIEAAAQEKAEEEERKAVRQLSEQLAEAQQSHRSAIRQLAELRGQLQDLHAAPIEQHPGGLGQETEEPDLAAQAQAERAQQIASLTEAIGQAEQAVSAANEQVLAVRESQKTQAEAKAEQLRSKEEQETLKNLKGTPIPVSAVATVDEELGSGTVTRKNGTRVVSVEVTPKDGMLLEATQAVTAVSHEASLPAGISFEVTGASTEQDESFSELGFSLLGAMILVLLVMVATFRSFRQPLILLVSVPFAATGAIAALLLTNTPLGLPAIIGLLMLIGIVVTNAIVLLDLINRLRSGGLALEQAVHHGTRLRLRPILMTATATIFALVPMALGLTGGSVFISQALAIVVIGGLVSSTLLTIVLVPILFLMFERSALKKRAKRQDRRERRAARKQGLLWEPALEADASEEQTAFFVIESVLSESTAVTGDHAPETSSVASAPHSQGKNAGRRGLWFPRKKRTREQDAPEQESPQQPHDASPGTSGEDG